MQIMQSFVSSFKQILRRSFVLSLMFLMVVSTLFVFVQQPSYAYPASENTKLTPQEKIDRAYTFSEGVGRREEMKQESYEEAIEESENPEKAYEENTKVYRKEMQPTVIEKAEELVETVTGK
jgi:sensor histidine kinase YesM